MSEQLVRGNSDLEDAVDGITTNSTRNGVAALNTSTGNAVFPGGNAFFGVTTALNGAGVFGANNSPKGVGVQGKGPRAMGTGVKDAGVMGLHADPKLQETTGASDGALAGVFGASDVGGGVVGYSRQTDSFGVIPFGGIRASAMNHPLAGEFNGPV